MEYIYFEAQLCIKISNFKGISNIDIVINLCLGASLCYATIPPPTSTAETHFTGILSISDNFESLIICMSASQLL